jgi:aryl-alcohol dehydrogenase-like predicted oxidoreductase
MDMKYRLFGRSGLRVSEVALGAMTFGEDRGWGSSKDEARKIYDTYRSAGGNFIDTANLYANGTSESFVEEFIHDHRQSVIVATKYTMTATTGDPNVAAIIAKTWFRLLRIHCAD